MTHDLFGDVADYQALDASSAMGRQDDEIGQQIFGRIEDRLKQIALADMETDFAVVLHDVVTELFEQGLRVLFGGAPYLGAPLRLAGVDAITISMSRLGLAEGSIRSAAIAVLVATMVNTLTKGTLVAIIAGPKTAAPIVGPIWRMCINRRSSRLVGGSTRLTLSGWHREYGAVRPTQHSFRDVYLVKQRIANIGHSP